ncbi:uncharacterized protein LOC118411184 [Branchiostoma floridae]|uniref:chitin synthase n=1 Tax=Branchiostoma floridae TaxID=7739 RepID=A0A9J7MJ11_BRAFL|nr:uncharacterized protein LOC118411184 [Branchiostoma floridae]
MAAIEMETIAEEPVGSGNDQEKGKSEERAVSRGSIEDIMRRYSKVKTNNNTNPPVTELWSNPPQNGHSEEQFSLNEENASETDSGHFENLVAGTMKEEETVPHSLVGEEVTTNSDNNSRQDSKKRRKTPHYSRKEDFAPNTETTVQSSQRDQFENSATGTMEEGQPVFNSSDGKDVTTNPDNGENSGVTERSEENSTPPNFESQPQPNDKSATDTFDKQEGDRNLPDERGSEGPLANTKGGPDSLPNGHVPRVGELVDEDHETNSTQAVDPVQSSQTPVGTLLAVLEVFSLALLVLLALPASPTIGLIVANLVFMNTVLTKSILSFTGDNDGATKSKIKGSSLFVLFLVILACLAITVLPDEHWSKEPNGYILVSFALLAVSWTPILHKLSVSKDNSVHPEDDQERGSSSGPNKTQNNTACWKLGIITNLVKCLVWALCVFLFYPWTRGQDPLCILWHIPPVSINDSVFISFLTNVLCGVFGYAFAVLALMMRMQSLGFLLPIFLSNAGVSLFLILGIQTPLCVSIAPIQELGLCETSDWEQLKWRPILVCCLVFVVTMIGMIVQMYDVWKVPTIVMEKESKLLWTPGYNSVLLDQWLLLTRRTDLPRHNEEEATPEGNEATRVFICTTMYHEIAKEMKQLMSSLWDIARTQTKKRIEDTKVEFEAHIFFDDGYKNGQVQDFALQLLSIIDGMGDMDGPSLIESCEKWRTPYGLQLQWHLHSSEGAWDGGMNLTLHLKDNTKVKNKKRWSQVMYMSYVLDYVLGSQGREPTQMEAFDRDTYILATDADVKFSPESAIALLDLARRDPTVGAVCGRTHPLGSGPMVWYQKFDYAVGHWYQKTANSVLGSVLCCPGCFSVYRAEALREALGTYAGGVSEAREFLMKDMGEDRWLCTLMVSNGWRLEYTAVSEDSTYCPEEFAEFYNQRRRWGPSTVANQIELIEKYFGHEMKRDSVSFLFMVYQGLLFFSGLIGPATCVLIIAGGLQFFNYDNGLASAQAVSITTVVVLSLVSLLYGMICLCTSQKFQLRMAMALSLCFAVLMTLVLVSLVEDTVVEFRNMTMSIQAGEEYNPSISTLYFLALVGMYIITGLVHITEFHTLFYGLVYFLSLPTGYILLTLYSVCNLTDRTWGTREGNSPGQSADKSLTETITDFFSTICGCCQRPSPVQEVPLQEYEEEWDSDSDDEIQDTLNTFLRDSN